MERRREGGREREGGGVLADVLCINTVIQRLAVLISIRCIFNIGFSERGCRALLDGYITVIRQSEGEGSRGDNRCTFFRQETYYVGHNRCTFWNVITNFVIYQVHGAVTADLDVFSKTKYKRVLYCVR